VIALKQALFALFLIAVISLLGCQQNKTTTITTPEGKTITTTTSPQGKVMSVTSK
jgi:uncharacterized lipoprotein YajG